MSTLVIKRIWIDKAECTGHGLCVPEAENLIAYASPFDFSFVRNEALKYTQQELALLLAASEVCPMRAFRVETEDGRIHSVPDDKSVRDALKQGNYRWSATVTGTRGMVPVT